MEKAAGKADGSHIHEMTGTMRAVIDQNRQLNGQLMEMTKGST